MKEYRGKTVPVTDFYNGQGILGRLDASRAGESVFKDVSHLIFA